MLPSIKISVCIVIYELRLDELSACVLSIEEAVSYCKSQGQNIEISMCIIDNGQNPGLTISKFPRAKIKVNGKNLGFGNAHNIAIRAARSDYHLIVNPDLIMDRKCIHQLLSLLESNSLLVMAGPKGLKANGEDGHLCKRFPTVWVLFLRGFAPRFLTRFFARELEHYDYLDIDKDAATFPVEMMSGCCMLARTKILQQLKGFDRNYFMYFEDFDLSVRLSHLGQIGYQPKAMVTHYGGGAAKKGFRHLVMFSRSAFRFYNTHGWRFFKSAS